MSRNNSKIFYKSVISLTSRDTQQILQFNHILNEHGRFGRNRCAYILYSKHELLTLMPSSTYPNGS